MQIRNTFRNFSYELATLLTGRAFEINLLPFSFPEYVELTGKQENPAR